MPIKDKEYWKIYNQKRKEKGYFQQNYLQRKQVVKNGEGVVKNNSVVKSEIVVKTEPKNILQPNRPVVKVVKKESLQPTKIVVKNQENILQPQLNPSLTPPEIVLEKVKELLLVYQQDKEPDKITKAKRYYQDLLTYLKWIENKEIKDLRKQLEAVSTLPTAYIDNRETELKEKHQKELEKLLAKIKELEQPINPTIELWKKRYFDLEKKTDEKWKELDQTIQRLKEKLRNKDNPNPERIKELEAEIIKLKTDLAKQYEKFFTENEQQKSTHKQKLIEVYKEISDYKEKISKLETNNKQLIQNYSNLPNQSKNTVNSLSMPQLLQLITKHKNYQTRQHFYSDKDIREREFLEGLLDKLWSFA